LFEFERRGFVRAGCFVPEVVLEKPEQLKALHEEFVHSGSDVVNENEGMLALSLYQEVGN
jgi:betaine-homocysteine S-methyltransferase